jgi:PAS domain S-box-containing protein
VIKTPIYDFEGRVIGIQGIFWDVTAQRQVEEALAYERDLLRALLEHVPDSVYFKDRKSRFLKASRAMARSFELADPELLVGKTDFDVFGHEHAQQAYEDEQQILASGQPIIGKTEKETWTNGRESWALTTKMPLYNQAGEIIGTFGISKDITELKQAEAALQVARDAALESARLKSEFLANVSHEIRTPMNAIIGMTGLLLDTELTAEQRDFAETVRLSADALLDIVNEVLDFSKIEAGKLAFECIDFNLTEVVESVVELLAERASRKGLELASLVESNVPTALRGDPGRLRQVLTNLIGNAVKFTEHGEVVVRVARENDTETQAVLRFTVTDTGIGIDPKAQQLIFRAFTKADGSMTRKYGGTGLGLAISKQLVELMQGAIGLQSEPAKGSTFWFTVRLDKQATATAGLRVNPRRESLAGLRVLIVDDSAVNREILQRQTFAWQMRSTTAAAGAEALELLRRKAAAGSPYDLAILDMQMPAMDGLSLARAIRADPAIADTRLVILTSLGTRINSETLREACIAAYLVKPVKQSRLLDCLANVMADVLTPAAGTRTSGAPTALHEAVPSVPAKSLRILVAEDNPVNQKVILRQLQKLGYAADAVGNGLEALEVLSRIPYDLVLLDCQMPEMDGYETARKIRQREADPAPGVRGRTPVWILAMTDNSMNEDRDKCLAAGMDDYLCKPVRLPELDAALQKAAGVTVPKPVPAKAGNAPVLDSAVLDGLRQLREPGAPDPLAEIIDLFLQDTPHRLNHLSTAVNQQDATVLKSSAHSLKGSASNLGARPLAALCAQLEKLATVGDFAAAGPTAARLKAEYDRVCRALEEEKRR